MHNGFEPPTGGSKFGEHREEQIWEKQSGGLFRSDCANLGIPSSVPKAVERFCVLRLFIMFWIGKIRQKLLPWSETMIIQTGMRTDIPAFYSQ